MSGVDRAGGDADQRDFEKPVRLVDRVPDEPEGDEPSENGADDPQEDLGDRHAPLEAGRDAVSAVATGAGYDGSEGAGQAGPLVRTSVYSTLSCLASTNFHGRPLASAWKIEMRPPSGHRSR